MAERNGNVSGNSPPHSGSGSTEENGRRTAGADDTMRDAERRAEEMVDRAAERVAEFTSLLKQKLSQVVARAREEAEDIWAEAQSIRRGEQ
jgi:hypothetical protein